MGEDGSAACGESVFLLTSDLAQTEGPSWRSLSLSLSLPLSPQGLRSGASVLTRKEGGAGQGEGQSL